LSGGSGAVLVVLALTVVAALWLRSREGKATVAGGESFARAVLGAPPGVPLLVEFTAPGCSPCGEARAVLMAASGDRPDVLLVTADVGTHLPLARRHGILRAPTTLLVDAEDRVTHRISGVPSEAVVTSLLDDAAPVRGPARLAPRPGTQRQGA
jgi:thioredoxin-like negative regulator of GroEL